MFFVDFQLTMWVQTLERRQAAGGAFEITYNENKDLFVRQVEREMEADEVAELLNLKKEHQMPPLPRTFFRKRSGSTGNDDEALAGSSIFMRGRVEANLEHPKSNVKLRVSEQGDMAIEDGVQAKYFFATEKLIKEANANLEGEIRLRIAGRNRDRRRDVFRKSAPSDPNRLWQVEPCVPEPKRPNRTKTQSGRASGGGLEMKVPQRCNSMAEVASGQLDPQGTGPDKIERLFMEALDESGGDYKERYLEKRETADNARNKMRKKRPVEGWQMKKLEIDKNRPFELEKYLEKYHEAKEKYDKARDEYVELTREITDDDKVKQSLRNKKLNEFTEVKIGVPIIRGDLLGHYHSATPIAKSGEDYITIENAAREDVYVGNTTAEGGDPLFFFQMYSTRDDKHNWHERAKTDIVSSAVQEKKTKKKIFKFKWS